MATILTQNLGENEKSSENANPQRVLVGTKGNTWIWSPDGWDLTRPADLGSSLPGSGVCLDCELVNIKIDTAKTALVIIDMQNIGLHKALNPPFAPPMYEAQEAIVQYAIPAARKLGLQVVWLNWGLTEEDLANMSPAGIRLFAFHANTDKTDYGLSECHGDPNDPANFVKCGEWPNLVKLPGADLGEIQLEDGSRVNGGRIMMRGAWNTALHGSLAAAYEEGKRAARPDVWIHKNRNSGLWKENSAFGEYLKANGIRTLLFSGVNTDQCVGSTLQDAHAQGFDTVMLKDGCGTDSPPCAKMSYEFNSARAWGFLSSCKALAKAAKLEPLEQLCRALNTEIDTAVSRLEKVSRSSSLVDFQQLQTAVAASKSSPQQPIELATLPCFIYPTSHTLRFVERTEDLIQIDRYFNNGARESVQPFRCLTLYGIGGIGKSSVALRYAETRIRRKELDAMFWIAGEKEVTIRQSFTDIAVRLKLPDAQPQDHDHNRTLVLNWLLNTECRWLLIYDNVESVDLLMTYWPKSCRGQAVVTTRNHNLASYPTDSGLEIVEWDTETGSRFLTHSLSIDISNQLTEEGARSAQELSLTLSGHALTLSLIAGLIHRRSWSIGEVIEIYKNQPPSPHGIFENSSINALWDMSFRSLSERARAILGVLSFLSPDHIPQALFEPKDPQSFPESLKFCQDPFEFSDEIASLTTLALVKRNIDQRAISLHRLVQKAFRHFMGPEGRQQSFNDATLLVSAAFPRKDAEFSQMYHSWKTCSLYLPHVLSLRDCFREEMAVSPNFSALTLYCSLNNACQRYLIEFNGYNDLLNLLELNSAAILTIPSQPRSAQIELEGELASHKGQSLARVGKAEEGIKDLTLAYELFASAQPRNLREEAWCAENLADGIASTNNFRDALRFQEIARNHWLDWAKENSDDQTEWLAILKWGMGTNLVWAGQIDRSKAILTEGLNQLEAARPCNWAMVAYTNYSLGTVHRANGDSKLAEKHFTEAYNKWISGNNLLSDPFCGACVYRMGCAALDQGNIQTAMYDLIAVHILRPLTQRLTFPNLSRKHLRNSSVITERHRIRMPVEHARSLFKLSAALEADPRGEQERTRLLAESKSLLLSRSPGAKDLDREKTYDDLVFIWWR